MYNLFVTLKDLDTKMTGLIRDVLYKLEEKGEDVSNAKIMSEILVQGKRVTTLPSNFKGLILSEDPLFIHCLKIHGAQGPCICVRILINADKMIEENKLGLPDTPYVFYSYSEYLKYITDKFKEKHPEFKGDVRVHTNDKYSLLDLSPIIKNVLEKKGYEYHVSADTNPFVVFELYQNLSDTIKKQVDEMVCPLTVHGMDVSIRDEYGVVGVDVDKKDFVLEHARLKEANDIISKHF